MFDLTLFENIPDDLKVRDQWVMWRREDRGGSKPTKPPYCLRTGKRADVTDPNDWGSYQECLQGLSSGFYDGIGFVLTDDDPYAFIDLDSTGGDADLIARQVRIFEEFQSYAEVSPSGDGLHIIVKGKIPAGRKRSAIEIYSSARFMTMTGNVYRDVEIQDCNELLSALWARMEVVRTNGGKGNGVIGANGLLSGDGVLDKEILTDEQVLSMAMTANNAEKFNRLYAGDWQSYYPSQSEADFALINIFAFYSQNRKQTARLFHQSALGQRDKAKREDYLGWMLNRSFDRLLPPVDIEALRTKLIELVDSANAQSAQIVGMSDNGKVVGGVYDFAQLLPEVGTIMSPPVGLAGEIMEYMFASAPRPVEEVAISGGLSLLAGITGRSYNVSNAGLNGYFLLIGGTGIGKESARKQAASLMNYVTKNVPPAMDFMGPSELASAPGVLKYMSTGKHSFVANFGEIGIKLKQWTGPNASPVEAGIRRFLLDIYGKSSQGDFMTPTVYSDSMKNTATLYAPSFSLFGESTHARFYEGLSDDMITEGLLPRFCIIEIEPKRNRPKLNKGHGDVKPSDGLVTRLSDLCQHSFILNQQNKAVNVQMDAQAEWLFDQFNLYCDAKVDNDKGDVSQSLWTRGYLKAMKIAAMLAASCNIHTPKIDRLMTEWSISLVLQDIRNLLARFNLGEIGVANDEGRQLNQVVQVISDFMSFPWSKVASYLDDNQRLMHNDKIVPYRYLQRRVYAMSSFRLDRLGAGTALQRALRVLEERGDIEEIWKQNMLKQYKTRSRGFKPVSNTLFVKRG